MNSARLMRFLVLTTLLCMQSVGEARYSFSSAQNTGIGIAATDFTFVDGLEILEKGRVSGSKHELIQLAKGGARVVAKPAPKAKAPGKGRPNAKAPGKGKPKAKAPGKGKPKAKAPGKGNPKAKAPGKGNPKAKAPGNGKPKVKAAGKGKPKAKAPGNGKLKAKAPGKGKPKAKAPDFVVTKDGTAFPVSQRRMRQGFDNANFPSKKSTKTAEAGVIHTVPTSKGPIDVRTMEGSAHHPRRAVFTTPGTNSPRTPDGGTPQGTKQQRRAASHLEQTP